MSAEDENLQALLADLDPTSRTLIAEVDLGMQAREFCDSDIGRYLIGCAHQEIAEAQRDLASVLPWRRRKITEYQNRIWRAQSLLLWLRDLLVSAQSAKSAIEERET